MIQVGSLGLNICKDCKSRFDCKMKPNKNMLSMHGRTWIFDLAKSARHKLSYFDDLDSNVADMKCVFDIKGSLRSSGWADIRDDIVILDGGFVNDLLEYCRYAYPGFERLEWGDKES